VGKTAAHIGYRVYQGIQSEATNDGSEQRPPDGVVRPPERWGVFANILVDQFQTLRVDPKQIFAACLDSPSAPALETDSVPTHR
jgi:hypothetical protein